MKYNNEFKIIDTPNKAYLLGLMYSDGCVSVGKRRGYHSYTTKISLTDKQIILDIFERFPFFNYAEVDFSRYNSANKLQYQIVSGVVKLGKDFIENGVLPRKSLDNKDNLCFPDIPDNLISHFIRGYFDGDGTIYSTIRRPTHYRVEIYSVSKDFLLKMANYIRDTLKIKVVFRKKNNREGFIYIINIHRGKDVLKFKDFIYYDSDLKLNRKKDEFDNAHDRTCTEQNIKNTIQKNKKNNVQCPRCKSYHVHKSGKCHITFKQRFLCKDCCRKFNQAHLKSGEFRENPEVDNPEPS